jgi:hypothetical protein
MRQLKWIVPLVIVLSLVLAPAAFAAPAPQYATCGYWYPVQCGFRARRVRRRLHRLPRAATGTLCAGVIR